MSVPNNDTFSTIEKPKSVHIAIDLSEEEAEEAQEEPRRGSIISCTRSGFLRRLSGYDDVEAQQADSPKVDDDDDDATVELNSFHDDELPPAGVPASTHKPSTRKLVLFSLTFLLAGLALGLGVGSALKSQEQEHSSSSATGTAPVQTQAPSSFLTESPTNGASSQEQDHASSSAIGTAPVQTQAPSSFLTESPTNGASSSTTTKNTSEKEDNKDCFPELVFGDFQKFPCLFGMNGQAAQNRLEQAYPGQLDIFVLPEMSPVTMDLRYDRVRIFVDNQGFVSEVPYIG